MRNIWLLLAALLALSGCAHTPNEVREKGERFERFSNDDNLERIALCVARNAENANGDMHAQVRGTEVVIRLDNGTWISPGTIAVLQVTAVKIGRSTISGWIVPVIGADAQALGRTFTQAC